MKRLSVLIDDDLDAELRRLARVTGLSKTKLVRDAIRFHFGVLPPLEKDPLWTMVGASSFEPVPPDKIDEVVYRDRRDRRR